MEEVVARITRDTEVMSSFILVNDSSSNGATDSKVLDGGGGGGGVTSSKSVGNKEHQSSTAVVPSFGGGTQHHGTFWQLSKELKMKAGKSKRYRSRYEEVYTDKDRAAAVNMGSRDIKQSLKLKRKAEKSKELSLPEETEPGALLALAGYEMTAKRTNIALDFINKALDLNAEDKNALVARSKCYLLLGEAQKALNDAESALSIDPSFIKALYQKAEALYHLGDFEHSLMYFHRGLRLRPDMEGFRLGVQKAQEAIENIIGGKTGLIASPEQLKTLLSGTRTVDELYKTAVLDLGKEASEIAGGGGGCGVTVANGGGGNKIQTSNSGGGVKKRPTVGKKRAERQLLGELYLDKVYLEELLTDKLDVINLNQDFSNNDVAIQAKEGIDFLTTRQDFWRQQKPKTAAPMKRKTKQKL